MPKKCLIQLGVFETPESFWVLYVYDIYCIYIYIFIDRYLYIYIYLPTDLVEFYG